MTKPSISCSSLLLFAALSACTTHADGSLLLKQDAGAPDAGTGCDYAGKHYTDGDSFAAQDGCNHCSCQKGGAVCTEIGCTLPPDAGAVEDAGDEDGGLMATEDICDASDGLRFAMSSGGGFVPIDYFFRSPYGFTFLFVDGHCRYYTSGAEGEIRTGSLSKAQARQLSAASGYASLEAWSTTPSENPGCADGVDTTLYRPGFHAGCYCGCDASAVPAAKIAAMQDTYTWVQKLKTLGTAVDGDIRAAAVKEDSPSGTPVAWPLSRAMVDIASFVQPVSIPDSALFTDSAETKKLRKVRSDALAAKAYLPEVSEAGTTYGLYLRDELPAAVATAVNALTGVTR
jgi:hypothetical protein